MVMWNMVNITTDYMVVDYIIKNFDPEASEHGIYVDKRSDTEVSISTRTGYGSSGLPTEIIYEASRRYPSSVLICNHFDEGYYVFLGPDEPLMGDSFIVINGKEVFNQEYDLYENGFNEGLHLNRHFHSYDISGNPTDECLSHHYGYIYQITHDKMKTQYIGQRKIKISETWSDYYGSGKTLLPLIESEGKKKFTKKFISFAENQEDLDLKEIRAITSLKENSHDTVLNIAHGANPATRNFIINKVFATREEAKYARNNGVMRKRITNFFNALTEHEYRKLVEDLRDYRSGVELSELLTNKATGNKSLFDDPKELEFLTNLDLGELDN